MHIHYKGRKVDVTAWAKQHPGGTKVLRVYENRDATEILHATHTDDALRRVEAMWSKSKDTCPQPTGRTAELQEDYFKLLRKYRDQGWFTPLWWEEGLKLLSCFVPFIMGIIGICQGYAYSGGMGVSLGWYLMGWTGHDYSHHAVMWASTTRQAKWNDWMGALMGGIRGNGVLWWKLRHNTHHVATNEVGNDPDIRTEPVFYFFRRFKATVISRQQHWYYLPALALLHVYWVLESWLVCIKFLKSGTPYQRKLALHDTLWMVAHTASVLLWGATRGWGSLAAAYAVSGFWTALVVFATHYGEERLEKSPDMSLFEQTVRTSRNICGFRGEDILWFYLTGGISHQIEHHLFPMMPTSYLYRTTPEVRALAKKYDMEWKSATLVGCSLHIMRGLYDTVQRNASSDPSRRD